MTRWLAICVLMLAPLLQMAVAECCCKLVDVPVAADFACESDVSENPAGGCCEDEHSALLPSSDHRTMSTTCLCLGGGVHPSHEPCPKTCSASVKLPLTVLSERLVANASNIGTIMDMPFGQSMPSWMLWNPDAGNRFSRMMRLRTHPPSMLEQTERRAKLCVRTI